MQFETATSIYNCHKVLSQHRSQIPVLADTEVELEAVNDRESYFVVKRVWKGMRGLLRYSVMEAAGMIVAVGLSKTQVDAQLRPTAIGFLLMIFAAICLLAAAANPAKSITLWMIGVALIGFLTADWLVLRRIIGDLQR